MTNSLLALTTLADPTRRLIFQRLATGPQPVGALARDLPVSRPAVSQHLAVLKSAGLVTDRAEGSRRIYRIDPHGLATIRIWLDQFWSVSLQNYADEFSQDEEAAP
ncbi:ArsR/SmtB family transcription factor [Taklimakanibacter lacteus]|uniref:ArsR/SmtB family transcription factor n=1 Tax=Taklimakanibacter lacteus TaxID=2268456 RepID=UPI000E670663